MVPWTVTYQPKITQEIIGQERALNQVKNFISNYSKQKKRALLLHGPPGSGKTSLAIAASKEFGLELFEINASDNRNKANVEELVGNVLKQVSLFGKQKLILIDEVDGLSGNNDRGGVSALSKVIGISKFPIIMTANDANQEKLKSLVKESMVISLDPVSSESIFSILSSICKRENISYDDKSLYSLVRKAQGDVRAAINDLEISSRYSKVLNENNVIQIDQRDKKESLMNALVKVLRNRDIEISRSAYSNVNEDLDEIIMWIDENAAKEYRENEVNKAYDAISKADVFRGRIKRRQHWRYLVYVDALLSAGVSIAKDESKKQFIRYERSKRPLTIWMLNRKYAMRNSVSAKMAQKTHSSTRKARKNLFYLKALFENDKSEQIIAELGLDDNEIEWLRKKEA